MNLDARHRQRVRCLEDAIGLRRKDPRLQQVRCLDRHRLAYRRTFASPKKPPKKLYLYLLSYLGHDEPKAFVRYRQTGIETPAWCYLTQA